MLPSVRAALGRVESTLGVRVCCCVCTRTALQVDDQKQTGLGSSKISKKKTHTNPYSYCSSSTQHRIPGVSYEGRHRVETAFMVARGVRSFCVALGRRYYQYTRQGLVWAWVLFFKNKIVRVNSSCEVRATPYQNTTRKNIDSEKLPVVAKISKTSMQIAHL